MATNEHIYFDEKLYPMAWRLNSSDCLLSIDDKKRIIFLNEYQSTVLWDIFFPFEYLIKMDPSFISILEKIFIDFDEVNQSSLFFREKLKDNSVIFFFWGRLDCAILPTDIFIKAWDDFFYPSDDNSIILIPNTNKIIFSYEETFFYGEIVVPPVFSTTAN